MANNIWSDVSSIANSIQEDAYFIVRETATMQNLVTVFRDLNGMNPRVGYKYNSMTANAISDADDLTSQSFTPSADQTLTPAEIGAQFFVTDARADSDLPENIISDGARELGFAANDKIETDLLGDMASLTGGTVGGSGSAITWSYVSAAIAQARYVNKSTSVPLVFVMHGYQWAVLAKSASIAGASVAPAPGFQEEITRTGWVARYMGVDLYQVMGGISGTDFYGGVFPRNSLAFDVRRAIRVEPERDASRRGYEFNMSAIYAHGVWRPALGISTLFAATAPTS